MFRGDEDDPGLELIAESLGLDRRDPQGPSLGMEAQSILKSIETETQKLQQFDVLARTDRHYFRARFNYYKLSILRLRSEERAHLEPKIGKFFGLIMEKELASDAVPEVVHTPFLEAVKPPSSPVFRTPSEPVLDVKVPAQPSSFASRPASYSAPESPKGPSRSSHEVVSELQLIRLALQANPSIEGNRLLGEALERVIAKLK
jgi:hypothetical protein